MDSLIVLRRPLKTVKNKQKVIVPIKPKTPNTITTGGPKPVSKGHGKSGNDAPRPGSSHKTHEKREEKISFVKLYNELCLREEDHDPVEIHETRKVKSTTDIPKIIEKVSKMSQANLSSESADAVLKKAKKHKKPKIFKKAVNAEVMLELDYGSHSKKSNQSANKK